MHIQCVVEADLSVGLLHLVHRERPEGIAVDVVHTEVGGNGVACHVQLHRQFEQQGADPVIVVLHDFPDRLGYHGTQILRGVLALHIAAVELQSVLHEFAPAVAFGQLHDAVRLLNNAGMEPQCGLDLVFVIHSVFLLSDVGETA